MKVIIYLTTVFVVVFSLTLLLDDVQCARLNADLHKRKGGRCKWCNKHCQKSKKKSKSKQRLCKWRRCNRCQAAGDPVKGVDTQENTQVNDEESKDPVKGVDTQVNDEESKEKIVAQHIYTKDSCEKWKDYKESCLAIMSLVSDSQIPFKCGNDVKNLVIDFDESSSASFKKATYKFEGESEDPKGKIKRGKCHLHFVPTPALPNDSPLARYGVKIQKEKTREPAQQRRRRLLQGGNSFDS